MSSVAGRGPIREVKIEAVVIGPCKHCGEGAEHWPDLPNCDHQPTFTRDLGVVSRWHRNPLVRTWWRMTDRSNP